MPRLRPFVLLALGLCWCAGPATAQEAVDATAVKKIRAAAQEALQGGEFEAAVEGFRKVTAANPDDGTAWQLLGYCLHAMGKLDEALPIHEKAATFADVAGVAAYNAACVHALQGRKDDAIAWLEKAVAKGFDRPEHVADDPDMDSLRADPRFAAIMKKLESRKGPERIQAYVVQNERRCARAALFGRAGSPAQIAIQYTPVPWRAKYDDMAKDAKMLGKKWRFGADFWTTLDSSVDLAIGGVDVPAGYYYLTLVQQKPGEFALGVHDPAAVRKLKIDASQADRVEGGIVVPLAHAQGDEVADALEVGVKVKSEAPAEGKLYVRFGGHVLTAPVTMDLGAGKKAEGKGYGEKGDAKSYGK